MEFDGYDLIGDVHGCARSLEQLLQKLGYRLRSGCYRHPSRQAIFIGDIVDRGTAIRESLRMVRTMVEQGSAQILIGNHEYNCVTYCEPARPDSERCYLREHNSRHEHQIRETLQQMDACPSEWRDYLRWFRQLPLYLETPFFRAVHACWDLESIDQLRAQGINNFSDDDFLHRSVERGGFEWKVVDRLLRGTYLKLPNNESMQTAEGFNRHVYRTKFWQQNPQQHQDIVFQPDPLPEHIASQSLTADDRKRLLHYGSDQKPLFIGHYWRQGQPQPITSNIVCLDYSAVKAGKLVAYRMDIETRLDAAKFVWVDVDPADVDLQGA
ncbi:MAG: metallophosphoesterase [Halopseudomonas sp.]